MKGLPLLVEDVLWIDGLLPPIGQASTDDEIAVLEGYTVEAWNVLHQNRRWSF